jgi:hypothetical protein
LNSNGQKTASFSLNIGSKKGSAFNNCNFLPPETQKLMSLQNPYYNSNTPLNFSDYFQKSSNGYGMSGMNTMGNLSGLASYGMNGMAQNPNGMATLTSMNGMPTLNPMGIMQGMPGMINMASMPNVAGMQGMQGFQMIPGTSAINNNMTGIPGMTALNGMNMSGFQGLNPQLNGFMGNGNAYSNYSTNPQFSNYAKQL